MTTTTSVNRSELYCLLKTCSVTRYECQPEEKTLNVRLPYTYTNEVPVKVCHMVAKTVEVPACGGANNCSGRQCGRRRCCS